MVKTVRNGRHIDTYIPRELRQMFYRNPNPSAKYASHNGYDPYGFSTEGLVLYLPLWALKGSAFRSVDAYGHTVTATNTTWQPNGRDFAGADYLSVAHHASLIFGTSDFYIWAWIKTVDTAEAYNRIVDKSDAGLASGGYIFYINKTGGALRFGIDDTYVSPLTPVDVQDGTWHFVGVDADRSGNATFYVDAAVDGAVDISAEVAFDIDSTTALRIGASWADPIALYLDGLVGEYAEGTGLLGTAGMLDIYNRTRWRY